MKLIGVRQFNKVRTSIRVPRNIVPAIADSMRSYNYGVRQRSKWICESLQQLVSVDDYWLIISEAFMDEGDNEQIPLTLDSETIKLIRVASEKYCEFYEITDLDQSVLLRASIMYRLFREGGGVVAATGAGS